MIAGGDNINRLWVYFVLTFVCNSYYVSIRMIVLDALTLDEPHMPDWLDSGHVETCWPQCSFGISHNCRRPQIIDAVELGKLPLGSHVSPFLRRSSASYAFHIHESGACPL
jgi:hypothetical protein